MQCPKCGSDMKYINAGVSKKTGKPYNAFWGCKDRNCNGTVNEASQPKENCDCVSRQEFNEKLDQIRKAFADLKAEVKASQWPEVPEEEPINMDDIPL